MGRRKRRKFTHKFSIVTAAFRLKGTLAACESLDKQTYKNWEHIIVNDNSEEVREYFQGKDLGENRFFCDMGKRRHWFGAFARNVGINYATGEFVLFLDDDNLFKPEHLANIARASKKNRDARMIGVYTEIRGKRDPDYRHILKTRIAPQQCDLGSFAYHKHLFRKYGYFEARPERRVTFDYEVIRRIYDKGEKFIILKEPTFIYYHAQR